MSFALKKMGTIAVRVNLYYIALIWKWTQLSQLNKCFQHNDCMYSSKYLVKGSLMAVCDAPASTNHFCRSLCVLCSHVLLQGDLCVAHPATVRTRKSLGLLHRKRFSTVVQVWRGIKVDMSFSVSVNWKLTFRIWFFSFLLKNLKFQESSQEHGHWWKEFDNNLHS